MHCSLVARLGPWGSGPSSHRSSRFCYPNKPIKSNCSVFAHAMLFHAFLALLMLFPGPQMASNHSPPHPLTLSASYLYAFLFCDFCILVVYKTLIQLPKRSLDTTSSKKPLWLSRYMGWWQTYSEHNGGLGANWRVASESVQGITKACFSPELKTFTPKVKNKI